MNITIIVDDFHGGAGNIAQLLATELSKKNKVNLILTNKHSEPRYELNGICLYDDKMSVTRRNKIAGLNSCIKRMKKRILSIHSDLVISFLDNNNTIACFALWNEENIPIIVSERSNPVVIYPKFPWNYLRRIAYQRANVVTVQFDVFKEFDKKRFIEKCEVTSNIVEKPMYIKKDWSCTKARFVTFGRLAPVKRMDLMIKLFAKAARKADDIELHIWGDGPEKENLNKLIEQEKMAGRIILKGYNNQVHETLLEYDAYLMTSYQEGFPNSLCEAMAVGLPSVSFMCHTGILELTEDNTAGFTVAVNQEDEFVEKIIVLAVNEEMREKMGKAAQKIVIRYEKSQIMNQWNKCIERAIMK
ncbi:glycosyltransferase [Lactonifactor longoviformis]|uniref:glycosyltransferase n=1 Tax=Lactonifactor longoviformis TaxID=341220 RepID=UPI0036F3230B